MSRIRTHTNPLALQHNWRQCSLNLLFDQINNLDVEIGFGRGVFINKWSLAHPERKVIGIEIRKSLVHEKLKNNCLENLKLFNTNAIFFIKNGLENNMIDKLFIFHPDPWFKNRHKKRKVITDENVALFKKKLKQNGKIYISTDVVQNWDCFYNCFVNQGFVEVRNDPFWSESYQTHWAKFTIKINKEFKFATFRKN